MSDSHTRAPGADAIAKLTRQRDELLAALGLIEVDKDGDGFICREAMDQVRRAIALATEIAEQPASAPAV